MMTADSVIIPNSIKLPPQVRKNIESFLKQFNPLEIALGSCLVVFFDECSKAYYLVCHLKASDLVEKSDVNATIYESEDDELYKLNRDLTEDEAAFIAMEHDASNGRMFEDIVLEYDLSYRPGNPLKVYGGQHRIKAITNTITKTQKLDIHHGIRVYFNLTRDQKVEIATVNNTSIAVPNDLLDRMREQLLGAQLRDWCQLTGLLEKGQDFSDRRDPSVPTVRIIRTLLVNYFRGLNSENDADAFHQPMVCKSGKIDEDYMKIREEIDWKDKELIKAGIEYSKLHKAQRAAISGRKKDKNAEFSRKAISLSVAAAWGYCAGLLNREKSSLVHLFSLPSSVSGENDPLNAKALSQARHKSLDPETYRGLGTRLGPTELGRMLEVFLVVTRKAKEKTITLEIANAAIKSYEAKRAQFEADKSLKKI